MNGQEPAIRAWIRRHKVCWELLPYRVSLRGSSAQVGFELNLYAQHEPASFASPGCPKCQEVFHTLQQIAHLVMPQESRPTRYEISPFDSSFHLRPENKMRNEVQLTMLLIHRDNLFDPLDECERKCATEIEKNLKELGAQSRAWSSEQSATAEGSNP